MRVEVAVLLLLMTSGCAARRVVWLDTGQGPPRTYTPVASTPVRVEQDAFESAVVELVLGLRWDVGLASPGRDDRLSLLAGGVVDGVRSPSVRAFSPRMCARRLTPEDCLGRLSSEGARMPMGRQGLALAFAFDTVWTGVGAAVGELADPEALRALVVSLVGTALVMLVAPEPITKLIAIGLTASLIAYLGTGPVWNLGQGFLRLREDARTARSVGALEDAGHRVGQVLGENGARVVVLVALTALGGKSALAAQGPRLPGFAQAAARARTEAGLELSGALAGEVRALALPAAGVLNVVLAPTAVAAVAMGPGSAIQGDPEGTVHHICTDKNEVSEASGGPWTPIFEEYFEQAGLSLGDSANMVRIKGHRGPHPAEYHQEVLRRIDGATRGCRGVAQCRSELLKELAKIARELTTAGTRLRALITRNPDA
ncbi:AHH domain-containing protein [Archangium primigenium]|uniref:AHH domain-containing protein n=1 Tax=[Archangium] primigenium TaxID=2792470 RepID=UPI00195CFE70|nr:AHH domain-containing protein [Archangium primigenium]MBM7112801.1 AHH domain-containing protein [Archangium primigenium]